MPTDFKSTDPVQALKHIRFSSERLRAFRRVVLSPEQVTVFDINGDKLSVEGVGWQTDGISELLHGVGASFDPRTVNDPPLSGEDKEYKIVKSDPWGQDRIM
jgi:hypothetical protein